jgi:ribosomal-protein-alanine N-acetyltransferase
MLEFNFHPFPVIQTDRLILRDTTMDDAPKLFELRKDVDVLRYINRPPHRTLDDTRELIQKIMDGIKSNDAIAWAVTLKNEPGLIGTISYHRIEKEHHRAEIGYMLHPLYWRKGIINEAMVAILDYGFRAMKLHSIEANVNPDNVASSNLLKKHGFVKEAHFKENYFSDGNFSDSEIYSLLEKNRITNAF